MNFKQFFLLESAQKIQNGMEYKQYTPSGKVEEWTKESYDIDKDIWVDNDHFVHRDKKPAKIYYIPMYDSNHKKYRVVTMKVWYNHGKLHRLKGPAVIVYSHGGQHLSDQDSYAINNKRMTKEEHAKYFDGVDPEHRKDLADMNGGFE